MAVFRGIPYGQAPVGPLRFQAPAPVEAWDGVRDAHEFGGSDLDDGLRLNVWSPNPGTSGLPVMVWICGGAYLRCDPASPHHDGATLAAAGAVVVSMDYRVGTEGFARIGGAPDNRGILDQAAALRWVQDNIAGFGGDPNNVTVFGQSAGAGSIAALLAMPPAADLFRRAIVQSLPGTYFSTDLAEAISTAIAAELGTRPTVEELGRFSSDDLIAATGAVTATLPRRLESWGPMALTPTPFSPVVDGDVLPQAPWSAVGSGAARGVDLLVGHTRDEFGQLAARLAGEITAATLVDVIEAVGLGAGGLAGYRRAFPGATEAQLYETIMADWLMRMPSLRLAHAQRSGGGKAWTYELCWGHGPDGASHGLDVRLVLGSIDHQLGDLMRTDWISFATTGDPGWLTYDDDTRLTRVYDTHTTTQVYPEDASRRIWKGQDFTTLPLPAARDR